ncbi:MAG: hypothetical protein WC539_04870 [Nitrospirota bacterium]
MRKKHSIVLTSLIGLFIIFIGFANGERNKPLNNNLPIYSTGFNVSSNMKESAWEEELFYKVKISFPAAEVTSFYDKEFLARGFIPYSEDGYGTRIWENFNSNTGSWDATSKPPARYIATWTDKEKTVRIVLFIRYEYDNQDKEWNKTLLVNCSRDKFFKFDHKRFSH